MGLFLWLFMSGQEPHMYKLFEIQSTFKSVSKHLQPFLNVESELDTHIVILLQFGPRYDPSANAFHLQVETLVDAATLDCVTNVSPNKSGQNYQVKHYVNLCGFYNPGLTVSFPNFLPHHRLFLNPKSCFHILLIAFSQCAHWYIY